MQPQVARALAELRECTRQLQNVEEYETKQWINFRVRGEPIFTQISPGIGTFRVFLRLDREAMRDPQGWIKRMRWDLPFYFDVSTSEQVEYAVSLVRQAHAFVSAGGRVSRAGEVLSVGAGGRRKAKRLRKQPRRPARARAHTEAQGMLLILGELLGLSSYAARSDRKRRFEGRSFSDGFLTEIPGTGLSESVKKRMANVDVIWFDGEELVCLFEVEASTRFVQNLNKLNKLLSDLQRPLRQRVSVYIVGHEKDRAAAEEEMGGPSFAGLGTLCRRYDFVSLTALRKEYEKLKPKLQRMHNAIKRAEQTIEEQQERIALLRSNCALLRDRGCGKEREP